MTAGCRRRPQSGGTWSSLAAMMLNCLNVYDASVGTARGRTPSSKGTQNFEWSPGMGAEPPCQVAGAMHYAMCSVVNNSKQCDVGVWWVSMV